MKITASILILLMSAPPGMSYIFTLDEQEEYTTVERVVDSEDHEQGFRFKAVEVMTGTSDNGFVEIKLPVLFGR